MLDRMAASDEQPMETLTIEEARAQECAGIDITAREPVARVEDRTVPGPAGPLPIRIYWPGETGWWPVLMFFHGGGFIMGSLDTHDALCRRLTNGACCVTVAVDYRLAPEHPFPAAVLDCYAATAWVAAHAPKIDADPDRIAVGGTSAGGNLAAAVTLLARDEGDPALIYQWLIYPLMDRPGTTPSYEANARGYRLTRAQLDWFWSLYLPDRAGERDPRAAPLQATGLHDLPPALVVTAEYDPLRDEGERYARRLEAAGVRVQLQRHDGMVHGFFGWADLHQGANEALLDAIDALRAAFSEEAPKTSSPLSVMR
jgi:acetyl esterase